MDDKHAKCEIELVVTSNEEPAEEFKGSFASVKVIKGNVYKTQNLYTETNYLDTCTLTDCAMSTFVAATNCLSLPGLEKIEISPKTVTFHMPYYGKTLHSWIKGTSREDRLQVLPGLIHQLAQACEVLLKNDIQHTDIKSTNIVISDDGQRLVLIDFNIFSVKTLTGWIESVGTWCYVAPEILVEGVPCDTSMSWSIGVIIAECIAGYPLGVIDKCVRDVNNRKDWVQLFVQLKKRFGGLPLVPKHLALMPAQYLDLYNICTLWNTKKRITISGILKFIESNFNMPLALPPEPSIIKFKVTPFKNDMREVHIDLIYKYCTLRSHLWNLIYRSIWLYDRLASDDICMIASCVCIAYIFMGYTITKRFVNSLAHIFDIAELSIQQIEQNILIICSKLDWKIYDKGADILALEMGISPQYIASILPEVMKACDQEYDGYVIAEAIRSSHMESSTEQTKDQEAEAEADTSVTV
jgi:serine/threonine protein kinase